MDLNAFAQYLVKNNILRKEHMQECLALSQMQEEAFLNVLKQNLYFSEERLQRYITDFQELQQMYEAQKKIAEIGDVSKSTLFEEMEKLSSESALVSFQEAPKTLLDPLMDSSPKTKNLSLDSIDSVEEIPIIQAISTPSKKTKSQSALLVSFSESLQTPKKSESSQNLKSFSETTPSQSNPKAILNIQVPQEQTSPQKEIPEPLSDESLLKEMESLSPKISTENKIEATPPRETQKEDKDLLQEMENLSENQQESTDPQKKYPSQPLPINDKTLISTPHLKKNKTSPQKTKTPSDHFIQNRYNLIEILGAGGMGVVQRVKDKSLGREVALKRIKMAPDGFQKLSEIQKIMLWRLSREAEITANLEHPNIVPVYDMQQQSNGEIYFTMRKVDGETLRAIFFKNRKYPEMHDPLKLLSIFLKICDAISYAHSRSIIHRDLKPENIMVGAYGNVYVMDWGIAKQLEEISQSTIISSVFLSTETNNYQTIGGIGTPGYMPPEQEKNANQVIPQSDVYALGVILRQCFTLLSPEDEFKLEISRDQQHLKSKTVSQEFSTNEDIVEKVVPSDIQAIYLKATEEHWNDRYESVEELANDVRQYLQQGRVSVKRYSIFELLWKWGNRNRKGIFFLLIIGILASSLYAYLGTDNNSEQKNLEANQEKREQREQEKGKFQKNAENDMKEQKKFEKTEEILENLQKNIKKYLSKPPPQEKEKNLEPKQDEKAEKYFLQAEAHYEKKEYLGAIEDCNLAIEHKLDHWEAYFLRARCKEKKGIEYLQDDEIWKKNKPKYPNLPLLAPIAKIQGLESIFFQQGVFELDGRLSSDPQELPLDYYWSLVNKPLGSKAQLQIDGPICSLNPDLLGFYRVQLVVHNGTLMTETILQLEAKLKEPEIELPPPRKKD